MVPAHVGNSEVPKERRPGGCLPRTYHTHDVVLVRTRTHLPLCCCGRLNHQRGAHRQIEMMNVIPAVVLISKLCPPGVEATVYSLLAGYTNFGVAVASAMGSLAMDVAGIRTPGPGGGPCNFDRLPLLIAIGHVGLPLLVLPLTFWLIPNARMTDDLLVGGGLPSTTADDKDSGGSSASADDVKDGEVTPSSTDGKGNSSGEIPGDEGGDDAPTTASMGSESEVCGTPGAEDPGGKGEAAGPTTGAPASAVGGGVPVSPTTIKPPTPLDVQDR